MKKCVKLMLGVLCVVGATACDDDALNGQEDIFMSLEGKSVITAHVPGVDSRVEFDATGNNIQVKWKESGETFTLYTNNPDFDNTKPAQGPDNFEYKNYTYSQVSGNKFAGDATLVVGNTIFAYYPCVGTYWNFMNAVPFQMGGQTGELDSRMTYMYISDVDVDNVDVLQFKHLTSLMKATFKLDGTDITRTIKQLRIFLPNGAYTDNYVDLTVNPIVYTYQEGSNEINITPEKELTQFYIYLPFGIEEGEVISFKVYDEDTYYTGQLTAAMDIETGKIYPTDVELTSQGTFLWTPQIAASTNVSGTGVSTDPFLIKTANDLQWMINDVSANDGHCYRLENDLTIRTSDSNPWIPIGDATKPFAGVLDGNNKTINGTLISSNVDAKSVNSAAGVFGFFGCVGTGGVVNNLWINAEVEGMSAEETYTGGIAGYNEGKISGSRSNKSVVGGNSTEGVSCTGGVVGYNVGTVENCTNSSMVNGSTVTKTKGYTGGVVGFNEGIMIGCSANGTITAAQAEQETVVGGIVAFNASGKTISGTSQNFVTVLGAESPINYIGGVVGVNQGSVSGYSLGISMSSPEVDGIEICYLGGIAAKNDGGTITNSGCFNGTQVKGGKANCIYVGGYVAYNVNSGFLQNLHCYDGTVIGGTGVEVSYTGGAVAYNNGTFSQSQVHYKTIGGSVSTGSSFTGAMVGFNDENGSVYEVRTQMGSSIAAGAGATVCTGVFAGRNSGEIYSCCYDGGGLSNGVMPLIGEGNDLVPSDEDTNSCLCPLYYLNNQ